MGGASVVNQLYSYESYFIIIPLFFWKGINPLEFSSNSKFNISIQYGNNIGIIATFFSVLLLLFI